jgi:hypothetical protein
LAFWGHAFADLGGQIGRVELGHEGVDAFGEAALGAVIQRLDHADQLHPEAAEQGPDGDVVFEVAGEPVDFVDHHHLHVAVALDAGQHGLEGGPVGAAGALAPLDVLPDDGDGVVGGVAGAGLALGGQRQAVLVKALVDLAA